MALATQCPFCQTTFRVAQDQLKLRGGLVRCGSCKEVFNGNEHLVAQEIAQQLVVNPDAAGAPPTPQNRAAPTAWPALPGSVPAKTVEAIPTRPAVSPTIPSAPISANLSAAFASLAAETDDAPWGTKNTTATAGPADTPSSAAAGPEPDTTASINTLTQELSYPIPRTSSAPQAGHSDHAAGMITTSSDDPFSSPLNERLATPGLAADEALDNTLDDAINQALNSLAADTTNSAVSGTDAKADERAEPVDYGRADNEGEKDAEEEEAEEEYDEDNEDAPAFVQKAERRERLRKISRIIMAIGTGLLTIALLLQATYVWRNTIAAWLPSTRPLLSSVCAALHCSVGLPTNIDQLSLESSELQLVPPNQNIYMLTLLLRNRGYSAQAWPYMELTLNDGDEKAITRRVFTPREYLASAQQVNAGLAGEGEQQVKLTFELTQPAASGYRIYLFFP